jgi:maltose alpha-D-glucosyltransferase/alpha-amylase
MTILDYLWSDIASNLTGYLLRQPWFLGRTRALQEVRMADVAWLRSPPAGLALVFLHCAFGDGAAEFYLMPLGLVLGERPLRVPPEAVIMPRTSTMAGSAVVYDAMADDVACHFLLEMMKLKTPLPTSLGQIIVQPSPALQAIRGKSNEPLVIHRSGQRTNRFVQYNQGGQGRIMLKLFSRLEPGVNPDYEIAQFLSDKTHFACMPPLAGAISYQCFGVETTVAILHGYEPHEGTARDVAEQELEKLIATARAAGPAATPEALQAAAHQNTSWAALLGQRTAELHQAMMSDPQAPAFRPEPMTVEDIGLIVANIHRRARRVEELWRTEQAQRALRTQLGQLYAADDLGQKIRCHGDFDLEQVLSRRNDFVIIDFEGEPERTLAERQRKQSPLKDVAGMIRSFDVVATRFLARVTGGDQDALTPWVRAWQDAVTGAFLGSYVDQLGSTHLLPADPQTYEALLWLMTLEKTLLDLGRAWESHPEWIDRACDAVKSLLGAASDTAP